MDRGTGPVVELVALRWARAVEGHFGAESARFEFPQPGCMAPGGDALGR